MALSLDSNIDRSIFYFIKDLVPSSVKVVDSFPISETSTNPILELPTVAVDNLDMNGYPLELGSRETQTERLWAVDIFAKTKTQRDELAYTIFNALDDKIPVRDYNQGFPPSITPSGIGCLEVDIKSKKLHPIYVFRDLVEDLYWRSRITFITEYYPNISNL